MKRNSVAGLRMTGLILVLLLAGLNLMALDTVIAEASVTLDGERADVRTKETNLANLITDIMVDLTEADLAVLNGGAVRATIPAGPVTLEAVLEVHPFSNTIVTLELTGSQILEVLEHGVSRYPEHWGGFTQVSGITYEFNPSRPVGERISEILYNGEPIDPEKTFVVATMDFLAAGGDGFEMMGEATVLEEYATLEMAMIQYFQENSPLAPETEGRITVR